MPDGAGHTCLSYWTNHRGKSIAAGLGPHRRRSARLAQAMTFVTESSVPTENFLKALNDVLPVSVRVLEVSEDARRDSMRGIRLGRRLIAIGFIGARFVRHFSRATSGIILICSMKRQWRRLQTWWSGNTTSLHLPQSTRSGEKMAMSRRNVRTMFASVWARDGEELVYTVRGSGFLHHMVRNLVGTFLLAVEVRCRWRM